jgi:WD40 repeat protein/tRNA A-37 threonylcarbamoyl transferase component Bud32
MASLPAPSSGNDPTREDRLHAILADYLEAVEAGAPPDRAELLRREPELAVELADFFANEDHLARMAWPSIVRFPSAKEFSPVPSPVDRIGYFGDYELLDVLAQGGMGVVYRARQVSLNRILALKMVRAGRLAAPDDLVRFRLEAEAIAHLDHPHIVPIYEVGEHEGHHYFSMKLIDGDNLARLASRFRSDPRAAARLVATVARAVHYAHRRGILHRDLKPANILLSGGHEEPADRLVPHVTDFGLAKRVEEADVPGVTSSGSIVGTPCYMAPEQAAGRREAITTAVDVHALGAILYELLVGVPPFRAESVLETLRQVREEEPARPRSSDRRVPRDLETIVLKCLEKSPLRRYPSAEALAEDLDRWLDGLPIVARPASGLERLTKWARRRPTAAALLVVAGLAILSTGVAIRGLASAGRLQGEVERTSRALDSESDKARQARVDLVNMENESYFKQVIAAEQAWEHNDPAQADMLLDRCPEGLRGWEWHHLRRRFHSELQTLQGHGGFLCGVAFKPDGTQVACAAEPRGFLLWESPSSSGPLSRRIPGHDGTVFGLAFDRAGTRMASAEASGQVRVWDLTRGELMAVLRGHEGWVSGVAFSADGARLATAGKDGIVRIWRVGGGLGGERAVPERLLRGHEGPVFGVAFSPDGKSLASAGQDATVRLWDLGDGHPLSPRVFRGHLQSVHCVAFHPGGGVLASAGADRVVRVWDAASVRERLKFGAFGNRVDGIAFSPDGSRIATASQDRSVKVWDAGTGRQVASFPGHAAPAFGVTFSPDGTKLASASQDATVKVWDLTTEPGARVLRRDRAEGSLGISSSSWVGGLAFRPDGGELAAVGKDRTLAVWDLSTWNARKATSDGRGASTAVRYSPDGKLVAFASADRKVRVRDARSLDDRFVLEDPRDGLVSLAFGPDGSLLATGGGDPPEVLQEPPGKMPPAEGQGRSVRLWDARTGSPLRSLGGHVGSIHALVFSPNGRWLISAGSDGIIRVWDMPEGRLARKLGRPDARAATVYALALSPDGKLLTSGGSDRLIHLWDLPSGRLVESLDGHANWVLGLAFAPDGSRLASAGADQTVRIWDPAQGRQVLALRGHEDRVHGVAFSPDGTRLASASADGTLRIWETDASASSLEHR